LTATIGVVNGDTAAPILTANPVLSHNGTLSSMNFVNAGSWDITASGAVEQLG
jgi:hypothetical protein